MQRVTTKKQRIDHEILFHTINHILQVPGPFVVVLRFIKCDAGYRLANLHPDCFVPFIEQFMRKKGQFQVGFNPKEFTE